LKSISKNPPQQDTNNFSAKFDGWEEVLLDNLPVEETKAPAVDFSLRGYAALFVEA
jgi:hypothetical protein